MIGTAPMFSTCAVFSGLGVAEILLLLPLRSTILKPYLYLRPTQSKFTISVAFCWPVLMTRYALLAAELNIGPFC